MHRSKGVMVLLMVGLLLTTSASPALAAAPSNDGFANATPIAGWPFSETVSIDEATVESGESVPCDPSFPFPAQTIWYSITPTSNAVLFVLNAATFQRHFIAVYRQDGVGLAGLTEVGCATWFFGRNWTTVSVEAGETYYIQAGSNAGGGTGTVTVSIDEIPPPANDDFADATTISSLQYEDIVDGSAATFEAGEPQPSCAAGLSLSTVWYEWTPTQSGEYLAQNPYTSLGSFLAVAAYTGTGFDNLSEVGCGLVGQQVRFHADAGVTHYFQVMRQSHQPGSMNFRLELSQVDNQLPVGYHERFGGEVPGGQCLAEGWTVDPDDRSARLTVRVSVDGSVVGEVVADQFRQDLIDAGVSPDGMAGFNLDLRGLVTTGEPHSVLVEAQDAQTSTWQPLTDSPKTINCGDSPPIGTHDGLEGTQPPWGCLANGWAIDPGNPTARLNIRVLVNGHEVATGLADDFRQDLIDAGVSSDGMAGFTIYLWGLVNPGKMLLVHVQAQDSTTGDWVDLNLSPKTLKCAVPSPALGIGFVGSWTAIDLDGSALSMLIGPGIRPLVSLQDTFAAECVDRRNPSGRWAGSGRGDYFEIWLFVNFTDGGCAGTPGDELVVRQFYWDEGSDTLWEDPDGDGLGITWYREPR